jgi:hypothetical protein
VRVRYLFKIKAVLDDSFSTGPGISRASVETIHRHMQIALGQGATMRLDDGLPE